MHKFRVVEGRPDTVSLRVRDGETVTVKWDGLKLSAMCTCAQNNERGTCSHAVGVLALDPLVLADDEDAATIDWLKEWLAKRVLRSHRVAIWRPADNKLNSPRWPTRLVKCTIVAWLRGGHAGTGL